jgi:phosphoribosyl 1,2-cyclic phosphate phosphodiesterase
MKAIILGSGGVVPPPRLGSSKPISVEAREKGIPYARTGSSFFIEDASLLFDTPEEVRTQLLRENISDIKNVIITHWHPDHTLGIRILEQLNWDFVNSKPIREPINVYICPEQLEIFKKLSCGGFLEFYEKKGFIKLHFFKSEDILQFDNIKVQPILIEETKGYYFLITDENNNKIVYASCEYKGLKVHSSTRDVDIFIAHNLFWEDSTISPRKIPPKDEDSFEQMLEHAKQMNAKRILIVHIEETFELSHDQLNNIFKDKYSDYNIEASYDGMVINL